MISATPQNFTGDVLIEGTVQTQCLTYAGNTPAYQNLGFVNNNVTVSPGATWAIAWGADTCGALNGSGNLYLECIIAPANGGLTVGNNNASGTFSGAISDGGGGWGITKAGTGSETLSGASNYSGATIVSGGTLIAAGNSSALGAGGGSILFGDANTGANPATLVLSQTDGGTFYKNVTTSNFGTAQNLVISAGSASPAAFYGTINLAGSVPLTITAENAGRGIQDITWGIVGSGVPSGSTALILNGSDCPLRTSMLSATPQNFTGDVVIEGTVQTQCTTYWGNTAANQNLGFVNNNVTVSPGAAWALAWGADTCGALNGSGNVNLNCITALTNIGLTIGNNNASGSFTGLIEGGYGVAKTGAGCQVLAANNTYTGGTTISGGTLQIGNGGASGSLGTAEVYGGGSVVDNAALVFNQTSVSVNNPIGGSGTVSNFGATGPLTIAENIAMTGNGGFNLNGVGAQINSGLSLSVVNGVGTINSAGSTNPLVPNNANNFSATGTGSINISNQANVTGGNGALIFGTGTLTTFGNVNLSGYNGIDWGVEFNSNNATITALSGTTTITGDTGDRNHSPYLFIGQPTVWLTANPGAAIVFTGGANSPTGITIFNDYYGGGTVFNVSGSVSFVSTSTDASSAFWAGASVFNVAAGGALTLDAGVTNMNNPLSVFSNGASVTVAGSAAGTMTGAMAINSGSLIYDISGTGALTEAGNISGAGGVVKNGAGTLTLSGNNAYGGGTTINGGLLVFNSTGAIPTGANNVSVNYGGALAVTGAYSTINGWLGSGNIGGSSAGVLALPAGANDSTGVSMTGFPSLFIGASGAATFSGSLTPGSNGYNLGGGGGALTVPTNLSGGNNLNAFGGGSGGMLILSGVNSYTGPTTIGSGGTLEFSNAANQTLSGSVSGAARWRRWAPAC